MLNTGFVVFYGGAVIRYHQFATMKMAHTTRFSSPPTICNASASSTQPNAFAQTSFLLLSVSAADSPDASSLSASQRGGCDSCHDSRLSVTCLAECDTKCCADERPDRLFVEWYRSAFLIRGDKRRISVVLQLKDVAVLTFRVYHTDHLCCFERQSGYTLEVRFC